MKNRTWFFLIGLVAFFSAFCIRLARVPTCEERGGHRVEDPPTLIMMNAGKVLVPVYFPRSHGEGAR